MPDRKPSIVLSLPTVAEVAQAGELAERAGFEAVFATEFYDRSATVPLAALAQRTQRVALGSAIAYAFGRTPLVLAAEARDLDELCGGRLILGLGTGTRRMQQEWHGLDGEHPASRMEELVPLLRRVLRLHEEGSIDHEGRFYTLRVNPTAPVAPPLRTDIPIYMAGVNARMIESAGRVADGLVGHPLFTAQYTAEVVRPALQRGAQHAGRDAPPPIAGYITTCVDADRDTARRNAAAVIAFNSTVRTYEAIHRLHDFMDAVEQIRTAWRERDFEAMVGAVTDEMIDAIALAGTAEEVRETYEQRRADLFEMPLLWPVAFTGLDGARAVIDAFA